MTRRIHRNPQFDVTLDIKDDNFINPPRVGQRQWLLNQAMTEFAADLGELDAIASRFVAGADRHRFEDRTQRVLSDDAIMENWQIPMMQVMAEIVTRRHGDILEIGFGRGVSAEFIQQRSPKSHTIIECNDAVVDRFKRWQKTHPNKNIQLIHSLWQDALERLTLYDGIFFHTYPLNEAQYMDQVLDSATFAEHFFATAAEHLRSGGVFTYLSNEVDSLSRRHQRALFRNFSQVGITVVPLPVPDDVKDAWWADSMVAVEATK